MAAKAFASLGIKKNDNVSLCMPAVPETIYAIKQCKAISVKHEGKMTHFCSPML